MVDLEQLLADIAAQARPAARDGEVAGYIPSMADLDPSCFGLALVEMDGTEHVVGDVDVRFPIQSISKVFSLVLAMEKIGSERGASERLWSRVGVEPSGDPFNSLVQLEHERGIPRNPMINAGALVVDDVLLGACDDARLETLELLTRLAGEPVGIDGTVLREEGRTGHRNRAMAFLMSSFGNLHHPVDDVLDTYVRQCAVAMTARQLARAMRFLANDGVDPADGRQVVDEELARRVAAIMLTCGTYDDAGQFAFDVGFPCKSGVAGAIAGVVTGRYGVCVWSPPLDATGNSSAGRAAMHALSDRLDLSLF